MELMAKKLLTVTFAFFFVLFISNKFVNIVQGQTPTQSAAVPPQVWRCLKGEQVGGRTRIPPPELDLTLTGAGYPSLVDIYVVLCVAPMSKKGEPTQNYKCTTGNTQYDRLIFNSNLTNSISPLVFQVPTGTSPPEKIQAQGDQVNTVVHMSNADGHVNYAYFGVTVNEPQMIDGSANTIQYGTFRFEQSPAGCLSMRWDPYGRVFDSQSLEPIAGVSVSLLNATKNLVILRGLVNPQRTERDGIFNFLVATKPNVSRTYYLDPLPLAPLTHTFTATPNLHPNYDKAYSDIYRPGEAVVETAGVPEHRDIPLDPGANTPFRSTPISMSKASVKIGRWTRYEGTVSHPLSIITLVGSSSGSEIARTNADKNGDWEILLPNDNIPQNEGLSIRIIKVDLTTLTYNPLGNLYSRLKSMFSSLFKFEVAAQPVDSFGGGDEFMPIPSYIEGYAKDGNGNVIANAIVRVKLEMSDGVYFQTKADENGFFTIAPKNLPIMTYYLDFSTPNGVSLVKNTAVEFAQNNQEYLSTNNISLMAASKNGESLIPTVPVTVGPSPVITNPSKPSIFAGNNLNLILTVIALVILLGVAGGVLMYIKKKQTATDELL